MPTYSGTYNFSPGFGDVILSAYARCGLRRPSLTAEHFIDAGREGNYLLSQWSNTVPNLWTSELKTQVLTPGVATYTLDPYIVLVLDVYVETTQGNSVIGRVLGPVSTTEYDAFPDKVTQGPPTCYWLNRLITPQITFWQPPDDTQVYTAKIRTVRQVQDASVPSGINLEIPYRFLDAYVAGLAHRLARIHAQPLEQQRAADAREAWQLAITQDTEYVNTFIIPQLGRYYSR